MPNLAFWKTNPFKSSSSAAPAKAGIPPLPSAIASTPAPPPGAGYAKMASSTSPEVSYPNTTPGYAASTAPPISPTPYPSSRQPNYAAGSGAYMAPQQGSYGAGSSSAATVAPYGPYSSASSYTGRAASPYGPVSQLPGATNGPGYVTSGTNRPYANQVQPSYEPASPYVGSTPSPSYGANSAYSGSSPPVGTTTGGATSQHPATSQYPATNRNPATKSPAAYSPPAAVGGSYVPPGAQPATPAGSGGSGYTPPNTGYQPPASQYQPGKTDYNPGQTGYQPPGVQPYKVPGGSYPSASGTGNYQPYQPGSTGSYQPQNTGTPTSGSPSRYSGTAAGAQPVGYVDPSRSGTL